MTKQGIVLYSTHSSSLACLMGLGVSLQSHFRMLDNELKLHTKASSSEFDAKKLSFVLEAKGVVQEHEIARAQSRIQSAFRQSLVAGFELFKTNLDSDQSTHRRHLVTASGDVQRARAAMVNSLQDWAGSFKRTSLCSA